VALFFHDDSFMTTPRMSVLIGMARPGEAPALARQYEIDGWDGVYCIDSQCLAGDVYAQLAGIAAATERVEIGTWVSNPATRHPAVTASAIATIDELSGGRAVLGLGRGDSALAHLGAAPVSVKTFGRYLAATRSYLAGDGLPLVEAMSWLPNARPVETLALGDRPADSRLAWCSETDRAVPVEVVASGPKMIELGAVSADRLTLAVGADVQRLRWAIELARSARVQAGLDPDALPLGAALSMAPLDDLDVARRLSAGGVASQARFAAMYGQPVGQLTSEDHAVLSGVARSYDMRRHGEAGTQVAALTDEFIDRFAIVGGPDQCVQRLREIAELGIDHVMIYMGAAHEESPERERAYAATVDKVLPELVA
jgi:5,10-methylenetetrahydromethanopterin reductase